jgi:hypothetical protein
MESLPNQVIEYILDLVSDPDPLKEYDCLDASRSVLFYYDNCPLKYSNSKDTVVGWFRSRSNIFRKKPDEGPFENPSNDMRRLRAAVSLSMLNKSMANRMPNIKNKLLNTVQSKSSIFFELVGGWVISRYSIMQYDPIKSDPRWSDQLAFVILRNNYFTKYNLDRGKVKVY